MSESEENYERQNFWNFAEGWPFLYAADRYSAGRRSAAGNRRIFYERNNVGNLRSAGRYGTGNRTESDPAGYERCR